jgi:hypothetical protein
MDSHLILGVHLVELVDAANSMVSQHQGSGFDAEVSCLRVSLHASRQTSGGGGLSRSIDAPGEEVVDVLQELGLSGGGVSHDADVDVSSQVDIVLPGFLVDSTQQLEHDSLLHVVMPEDSRCQRVTELVIDVRGVSHPLDRVLFLDGELFDSIFGVEVSGLVYVLETESAVLTVH